MHSEPVPERRVEPADWDEAVAAAAGPQLVVGGPGSGKTEFLVRRGLHLLLERREPPGRLLALSFSRRGAADLRRRLETGMDRSYTALAVSTFHSLAHRLLEAHAGDSLGWKDMPTLLTAVEQVALVGGMLQEEEPVHWPVLYQGLLGTATFAKEVTDFLLRCQERLIDPAALEQMAEERTAWRALPAFLARYTERLKSLNRIDYGSLQARAVELLTDPAVRSHVGEQFHWVLVDEYQDTTTAQASLLAGLYQEHRNLTVAGDPYQSIYSFRGTDLANIERFPLAFPDRNGRPAERLVLTTSFRVPGPILDAAVRVTAGTDLPGAAGPVVPAPGPGSVEAYRFHQETEETEWIAAEIQRLHLEQQMPLNRMAVFVRSTRTLLPELSRSLERRRLPHVRPDGRLSDDPAVRAVLDCVVAATESGVEADRAVRRVLLGPLFRLPLGSLRELERLRSRTGAGWPSIIADRVPDGEALAALLADGSWADRAPAVEGFWHLWSSLDQFRPVATAPDRVHDRQVLASMAQVLGRLFERDPAATLARYLAWIEQEDFEDTPLLELRSPDDDLLTLTTLHQSKGLSFEVVFIAGAVEGVLPDLRPRESLLESRHLSPHLPAATAAYTRFRLQEETRLAYTAMTRASRRVVWTCTAATDDERPAGPSRFLRLVAGTDEVGPAASRPEEREPVTTREFEARLRRLAADPAAARTQRLAAVAVLASGEAVGLRPPDQLSGMRPRGTDTGLVPPGLVLSPTQAEDYDRCPRRYALERRLGIGDEESVYTAFGRLIHLVLERTEHEAMTAGADHGNLERALVHLAEAFDPAPFGGSPWGEAWYRRGEAALTRLYGRWPGKGPAVALERMVEMELEGVGWRGKLDRLEAGPDGLRVVDYKTSKTPATLAEAASSLQLGFYWMAAAEQAVAGPVAEAEFWYPLTTSKGAITTRAFDPGGLAGVASRLGEVAAGIAAENWRPRPGPACDRCRVRLVCPAWPDGREAFV